MAAPVSSSYTVAAGQPIYGGKHRSGFPRGATLGAVEAGGYFGSNPSLFAAGATLGAVAGSGALQGFVPPVWRMGATANTWLTITSGDISAVDPANDPAINPSYPSAAPWKAVSGQVAVIGAWGSCAWDDESRTLWIPNGGGHDNYAGNETYALPVGDASPAWSLKQPPTGAIGNTGTLDDGNENTGVYFDGRPRSSHIYNSVTYAPGVGAVMVRVPFNFRTAGSSNKVYRFDPVTGAPSLVCNLDTLGVSVGNAGNSATCYVPARGANPPRIYSVGTQGPHKMTWVEPSASPGTWNAGYLATDVYLADGRQGLVYIPTIDRILHLQTNSESLYHALVHPDTGATTNLGVVSGTLPTGFDTGVQPGADWNSDLGWLGVWCQTSSTTTVSKLTPSASPLTLPWLLTTVSLGAGNAVTPVAAGGNGVFGRWRYSHILRGFVLVPSNSAPTVFFATE